MNIHVYLWSMFIRSFKSLDSILSVYNWKPSVQAACFAKCTHGGCHRIAISLLIMSMLIIPLGVICQTPMNDAHWEMLWSDEFESAVLSEKWGIVNNSDHNDPDNCCGELQVYTSRPDNVFIENGYLILRARNEIYQCPPGTSGCVRQNITGLPYQYTSGEVTSMPAYNPQYGYIESSMVLPYGNGFWPAFWTWTGSPSYQEIDIFEMIPGPNSDDCNQNVFHNENRMTNSFHLGEQDACVNGGISFIADYRQPHKYAIEWSPDRIIYYINEYPVRYVRNVGLFDPAPLIINFAIRSAHGPDGSTPFPSDMKIDYVRVYELRMDCDAIVSATDYDFTSYDNLEKNFIEIGDNGGNNNLQVGDDIKLRASQYITISGNFQVPVGAGLYLDADRSCLTDRSRECSLLFNPCVFNFEDYNNDVVNRSVDLGGPSCEMSILATTHEVNVKAVEAIILNPGVEIPPPTSFVALNIVLCTQ